ncbi:type II toxin-antitoxin system VapC family toxin [Antrihabitans sp. NCIMB 15449]|uniref:Ribonuclease VapC n=1 Tax=Antrihabitans spumae TaxID=3373370 RepID=A0ABW7JRC8_9NOCA
MKIVDANVLLYSVDRGARQHRAAKGWLDRSLSGIEPVGFAWIVVVAFLRLSTNPRIYARPLSVEQALDVVESWLSRPQAVVVEPSATHLVNLRSILVQFGGGNLTNDAHLAALALQHRATVVTFDHDFARFEGVAWIEPD